MADDFRVRRAGRQDDQAVLALLSRSLGWVPDELHAAFFDWKHRANPFGSSPSWVAVDGDRVAGFRTFLRWEFEHPDGTVAAVRAVDTATHPDYRGRGIFRRLTLHAVEALGDDDARFVFNTPNERSRPGYVKMGWQDVGRLAIRVRPRALSTLRRTLRARTAADMWSLPCEDGMPAREALTRPEEIQALLASQPPPTGLRTRRTAGYLLWRYGFEPLAYRALAPDGDVSEGLALFRLRRRGPATEVLVGEVLAAEADTRIRRRLLGQVLRCSGADHAVCAARDARRVGSYLPLPRQGPRLTWRGLTPSATCPPLSAWRLSLGDVELL